jgi:NAD(P)-dependent dehydrogenase (short-subunit alcohol dehydrogenase family)
MSKPSQKRAVKIPPQKQHRQPGKTGEMKPQPQDRMMGYKASGKLTGKVAIITGGDSGIGRATAIAFAKEGADIAIAYLNEYEDASETQKLVEKEGRKALLIPGDIGVSAFSALIVEEVVARFGHIDVVVNNAAEQHPQDSIEKISPDQLERTFRTNIFGMFYLVQAALPHLKEGSAIINTASITAYRGSPHLLDYASTKGAIIAFTRSLAQSLAPKGIRVNAVAPGPIWTPLIPSTFPAEKSARFGKDVPMGRPGQPDEVAPSFVFLASDDSSYMSGQVLHPNGGVVVNA